MTAIPDAAIDAFWAANGRVWKERAPITQGEAVTVDREATRAGLEASVPLLLAGALEDAAEDLADYRRHVATLRHHMAQHGLEDPTWRNLSEREKAVLRAADDEVLAS